MGVIRPLVDVLATSALVLFMIVDRPDARFESGPRAMGLHCISFQVVALSVGRAFHDTALLG